MRFSVVLYLAIGCGAIVSRRVPAPQASCIDPKTHAILTFVRHGQSEWNEKHIFTGWSDIDLTELGRQEAVKGGAALHAAGIDFDIAFTSELKRAQNTLTILLNGCEQPRLPVVKDYRLNERHYGALQGRCKYEVQKEFGKEQVQIWSRSYDVAPPPVEPSSEFAPHNDHKYDHLPRDVLPLTESLKDQMERCRPFWRKEVEPALRAGKNVLVVTHGNAIRGCVKLLDDISDADIPYLEIPNGMPLVYQLDANLQPLVEPGAVPPLSGVFVDHLVLDRYQNEAREPCEVVY
mmetsp:Transcript_19543/g.42185  ORF Transcript_19543/g.42185 Transcript_19543/m.42185 type:complete len:291 (+) Transcript_19543:195-1067(+)